MTSKYAMGQINSSFSGSSGIIFLSSRLPIIAGAHNGCAKTLGTRLLNGWQLSVLSTFEVAARHESFALAADEMALTPSAVSHRINQLEEELGIQLFVRSHRKVELTREGKRVYWALKSSLDGLNQEILDIKTVSSPAV
nr:Gcv operon activator [Klebsiella pneumoniae]